MSFVLFASYVLLLAVSATEPGRTDIEFTKDSLEVVKKNVSENKAVLVDVRSQEEWNKGFIEGSIFLPSTSLRKHVDPKYLAKMLPKKKIIYTFCVVGMRAKAVGKILENHGYTVRVLRPGYDELLKAGFKQGKSNKESQKSAASDENTRQRNAG